MYSHFTPSESTAGAQQRRCESIKGAVDHGTMAKAHPMRWESIKRAVDYGSMTEAHTRRTIKVLRCNMLRVGAFKHITGFISVLPARRGGSSTIFYDETKQGINHKKCTHSDVGSGDDCSGIATPWWWWWRWWWWL